MPVDKRFLDPSGWRPTEVQMSVRPNEKGVFWEEWIARWHGFRPGKRRSRPVAPSPAVEVVEVLDP